MFMVHLGATFIPVFMEEGLHSKKFVILFFVKINLMNILIRETVSALAFLSFALITQIFFFGLILTLPVLFINVSLEVSAIWKTWYALLKMSPEFMN